MTKRVHVFAIDNHQTTCTDLSLKKTEHVSDVYLVFDLDEVKYLRKNRICGQKIGTGSNENVNSNEEKVQYTVPLQLSKEELGVLIEVSEVNVEVGHSVCIDINHDSKMEDLRDLKKNFDSYIKSLIEKSNVEFSKAQSERLFTMKNKILEGKRKKLNEQLNKLEIQLNELDENKIETIEKLKNERKNLLSTLDNLEENFESELISKKSPSTSTSGQTQKLNVSFINAKVFTTTPEFYRKVYPINVIDNNYIMERACYDSCKYRAYKYLWKEGFYMTCGAKFGGDFLVYEKDPALVHSKFILVCIEDEEKYNSLTLKELITYARMATCVKKTFLLAFYDANKSNRKTKPLTQSGSSMSTSNNELSFISINWSHLV